MKKYRSFNVEVVNNGFIATIGCQRLIFRTLIDVADALIEYWKSPDEAEKQYMENSMVFSTLVPEEIRTPYPANTVVGYWQRINSGISVPECDTIAPERG